MKKMNTPTKAMPIHRKTAAKIKPGLPTPSSPLSAPAVTTTGEAAKRRNDRGGYKRGGSVKAKGTTVNIVMPQAPPAAGAPGPMPIPAAPPVMIPPPGPPPGLAGGLPPPGGPPGPPMLPPGAGAPGMNRGGRAGFAVGGMMMPEQQTMGPAMQMAPRPMIPAQGQMARPIMQTQGQPMQTMPAQAQAMAPQQLLAPGYRRGGAIPDEAGAGSGLGRLKKEHKEKRK